jgi:hypothetical protein
MGAGCSSEQAVATSGDSSKPGQQQPAKGSENKAISAAESEARRQARMKLMSKCFAALDVDDTGYVTTARHFLATDMLYRPVHRKCMC